MHEPLLPVVPDAVIDCGAEGGVVAAIDFASWGRPSGICGEELQAHATCHHPDSRARVEALCLGRARCAIPSTADFWGNEQGNRHCAQHVGDGRALLVQATCSAPSSVAARVAVPIGKTALLRINGTLPSAHAGQPGVLRVATLESGLTEVTLGSGSYALHAF